MMVELAVAGSKASDPLLLWERVAGEGRVHPNGGGCGWLAGRHGERSQRARALELGLCRPFVLTLTRLLGRPSVRSYGRSPARSSISCSACLPLWLAGWFGAYLPTYLPSYLELFLFERWLARASLLRRHLATATPTGSPLLAKIRTDSLAVRSFVRSIARSVGRVLSGESFNSTLARSAAFYRRARTPRRCPKHRLALQSDINFSSLLIRISPYRSIHGSSELATC